MLPLPVSESTQEMGMGLRFHRKCDEKGDLLGKGRVVHWEPTSSGGILGALVESSNRSSDEAFHSLIFGFVFLDPLYFPYCNERIVWKRHALYF